MPKDNEVDETPHWGDLMREIRSKVPEGLAPLVDRLSFACDQRLSFLLHERYEQDLSHAATVAELRAEVERLRKSNELYSFAMNTAGIDELKRRADAAERRLSEVREIQRTHYGDGIGLHVAMILWTRDYDALTGADPT